MDQEIQFCTTADNVSIAYASVGTGPPLVKAANWMNHLEYDWESPVWSHFLEEFARDHTIVRYDERGTGLSDRRVEDFSLDGFVRDLEAVIDASQLETFPMLAISQGGPVAIEYISRNPGRVSKLVLHGSFPTGWKRIPDLPSAAIERREAEISLIRHGWGNENPAFRQFWTTLCIPDGNEEEECSFNEMQRISVSPENAARIFEAIGDFDVSDRLPILDIPVLVLHSRLDATVTFEEGRRMASMIPGAKFVPLDSRDHLILRHEPAWQVLVHEIRRFLGREARETAQTLFLKRCGKCSRVYSDETMLYCLDDGTSLTIDPDDTLQARTQMFPTP
jgi:pimeloyl-ACP methyl ester carboxylesterase